MTEYYRSHEIDSVKVVLDSGEYGRRKTGEVECAL